MFVLHRDDDVARGEVIVGEDRVLRYPQEENDPEEDGRHIVRSFGFA